MNNTISVFKQSGVPTEHELVTMNDNKIIAVRGVDNKEAEAILSANTTIHKFHNFVRKFNEVEQNYKDYWRTFERYEVLFKKDLNGEKIDCDYKEASFVDINRAYNNYVSSVKAFTELCRYKIKTDFGKDSHEHKEFEAIASGFYDGNLSYRLIQKTRDFALHSKFSIQQVAFVNEGETKVIVSFDRDLFLANNALRKALKSDIEGFNPFFEVAPFIKDMPQMIESVLRNYVRISKTKYEESANLIIALSEELASHEIGLNKPDYSVYGRLTNNSKVIPVYMAKKFHELLS